MKTYYKGENRKVTIAVPSTNASISILSWGEGEEGILQLRNGSLRRLPALPELSDSNSTSRKWKILDVFSCLHSLLFPLLEHEVLYCSSLKDPWKREKGCFQRGYFHQDVSFSPRKLTAKLLGVGPSN